MIFLCSQTTLLRLGSLRIGVSHTYLYKKLDEYGADHLKSIWDEIEKESKCLPSRDATTGRKLIIDNFNFTSHPHEMTEERQNKNVNWVGLMICSNRISGNHLSSVRPQSNALSSAENGCFLPNKREHAQQRSNYIAMCGRIATENIKCLQFLEDVAVHSIPHRYSHETCKPTNTVSTIAIKTEHSIMILFFIAIKVIKSFSTEICNILLLACLIYNNFSLRVCDVLKTFFHLASSSENFFEAKTAQSIFSLILYCSGLYIAMVL